MCARVRRAWLATPPSLLLLLPAAAAAQHAADAAPAPAVAAPEDPLLSVRAGDHLLAAGLVLTSRGEDASAVPTDRAGSPHDPSAALDTMVRAGLRYESGRALLPVIVHVEGEVEALSGVQAGGTSDLEAVGLAPEARDPVIRKAFARVSLAQYLTLGGGYTVSHHGLGLVANDGAHGHEPGDARFIDPRGGDRVLRLLAATGPWTDARIVLAGGFDPEVHDDVTLEGDEATQAFGSLTVFSGKPSTAGVYVARRAQTSADGDTLDVTAFDLYGKLELPLGASRTLTVAGEGVIVTGETTLGATPDVPTHEVLQLGGALRSRVDLGGFGAALDLLYASGDQNLDDEGTNGFKADPNFDAGLLLFRHVLAAQSARGPVTASDPLLVGEPADDLDRLPTRGSVTNTIAIFPRGVVEPIEGLEVYGGPLFAFAEVPPVDPLNTRFAGGAPRNALDGEPGGYLGTELDAGVRYGRSISGVRLDAGVEGGVLFPGSALAAAGGSMDSVTGARALVRLGL